MKKILVINLLSLVLLSCDTNKEYYVKHVSFPADASLEQKIDMASRLVPTPQQFEWQKMELTAFLHFGINTFTGREWGDGTEDPNLFNPISFDAEQWVRSLKDAGFKMAVITAKHHDGFCLWPTSTTKHSVASSGWMNGKGDVVKSLKEACDKYGLRFGVYLSPWDRNAESYGTSGYNEFYVAQLSELLTNYGEIYEVWFDGANGEGPNGKKQEYDWPLILSTIRRLQPKAVTAIMGDDVRWVGNESGLGRETEWSATVCIPGAYPDQSVNKKLGINVMSEDLGSRQLLKEATDLFWYPSEVDVSIRPGWFYHAEEDSKVRSLSNLVDIYFQSAGYNSVLLLNIPPDRRGLIHENDVERISELSRYLISVFNKNYVVDGDKLWQVVSGKTREYNLERNATFNTLLIQEDISKGQRVEKFKIEVLENGQWKRLANGTTIGYKRMFRIDNTRGEKIRVTIEQSRNMVNIIHVAAYYAPALGESNDVKQNTEIIPTAGWKIISPSQIDQSIFDGDINTSSRINSISAIEIDMGKEYSIDGFVYTPIQQGDRSGTIYTYGFYTSNGIDWIKCNVSGEFSNIKNNSSAQYVYFEQPIQTRYIKFEPLSGIDGKNCTSIAEIAVFKNNSGTE